VTEYRLAYYELLQNMIWLEGKIGTAARVTEYTGKAAALKHAINARLLNASAGLYVHTGSLAVRWAEDTVSQFTCSSCRRPGRAARSGCRCCPDRERARR
jgi:hypothetical protein